MNLNFVQDLVGIVGGSLIQHQLGQLAAHDLETSEDSFTHISGC